MGRRRKKIGAADVGAIEIGGRELEPLATLADGAGDAEAARMVLDCVQLADGLAQLAQLKKVGAVLQRVSKTASERESKRESERATDGASERARHAAPPDLPAGGESGAAREVACCLRVLALAYLTVSWTSPLKRALASLLESQRGEWRAVACDALAGQVSDAAVPSGSAPRVEASSQAEPSRPGWLTVSTLACCLENFPLGEEALVSVLPAVLEFLLGALDNSVSQARECAGQAAKRSERMHEAQAAIKTTMVLLQKGLGRPGKAPTEYSVSLRSTSTGLIRCFVDILSDVGFLRTCRGAAAMAAVLLLLLGPDAAMEPAPLLALVLLGSREAGDGASTVPPPAWASDGFQRLCDAAASNQETWLSVCHGTLAMLDWGLASNSQLHLLLRLLHPLLELAAGSQEPSAALTLARTLTLWTTSALAALGSKASPLLRSALTGGAPGDESAPPSPTPCSLSPTSPTSASDSPSSPPSSPVSAEACASDLLVERYVWVNLDYPLDGVRHEARHILTNLLRADRAAVAVARRGPDGGDAGETRLRDNGGAAPTAGERLARGVARRTLALGWRRRAAFGAARALVEVQGASWLLALAPGMPRDLLAAAAVDPAMCPHVAEVLQSMSRAHLQEIGRGAAMTEQPDGDGVGSRCDFADPWLRTWVSPLLEVLCSPTLGTEQPDGLQGDADVESGRSRVVEQCLPQLLQSNPACLALTVQALKAREPGSRGSLAGLVACVRAAARTRAVLPPDGDARAAPVDRLLLGEELMGRALVHRCDQVRLDALALLCESVRATEPVRPRELALLRAALPLALPSWSPATRRATLSLLRKLLLRMRDGSLAWLRRSGSPGREGPPGAEGPGPHAGLRQYREFLVWLSDISFDALFPGASFPRQFMALSILGLLEEVFPDFPGFSLVEVVTPARAHVLLGCLANNFPEVKQLASALLQLVPAERLRLQTEECLRSLLGVALALASSPRPGDHSTAAPLLALLVRRAPRAALRRALIWHASEDNIQGTCPKEQDVGEVTEVDAVSSISGLEEIQDKTDSNLESNTLAVLGVLVSGLEADAAVAEHSLLEAASTRPMYGRLHTAAHLLHGARTQEQWPDAKLENGLWKVTPLSLINGDITGTISSLHLRTLYLHVRRSSLYTEPTWRLLLERLLSAAWRVSRIASSVVNSSSPEGFIPDCASADSVKSLTGDRRPQVNSDTCARGSSVSSGDQPTVGVATTTAKGGIAAAEEEREGARSVTAQAVLLCCWRSMKEISLLLGQLSQHAALQPSQGYEYLVNSLTDEDLSTLEIVGVIWPYFTKLLEAVGHYFRQQLLESRHRGAFELAYVGFGKLVDALARSEDPSLHTLPRRWLEAVLGDVEQSAVDSKLCATRRSAGVPFYVQALVSAERKRSGRSLLRVAMTRLLPLALPQGESPIAPSIHAQVHALNILRALFRDSRLGDHMTVYIPDALRAAILGFTSPIWAVCNSCTLLFSTLITRVFGAKRARHELLGCKRMTGREFFSRFPSLHPFLLEQLAHAASACSPSGGDAVGKVNLQPALFPLLLLLAKLYPSPLDGTYTELSLAPFLPLLVRCGQSPVWRARIVAAQALVAFIPVTAATRVLCQLLDSLPRGAPQSGNANNHAHGTLLQVQHLVRAHGESLGSSPEFVPPSRSPVERVYMRLLACMWLATRMNPCAVTRAAYLDILSLVIPHGERTGRNGTVYTSLVLHAHEVVSAWLHAPPDEPVLEPGRALWQASAARLALALLSTQPCHQRQDESGAESSAVDDLARDKLELLRSLLLSPACEVHSAALRWLVATRAGRHRPGEPKGTQLCGGAEVMEAVRDLAVQEMDPQCRTEAFRALCLWPVEDLVPWPQGVRRLAADELLDWIVVLIEANLHSVDLRCAALKFSARVVQHLLNKNRTQKVLPAWACCIERWIRSVVAGGTADTWLEVRVMSAEVIGEVAALLLANDSLPLGLRGCLNMWGALLGLLQDDDAGVRAQAVTALCGLALRSAAFNGAALEDVMPNHALNLALKALMDLLGAWGLFWEALPTLLLWLLEDEEQRVVEATEGLPAGFLMGAGEERENENEFLFDKGEVNLFAERLLFARHLFTCLEEHLQHVFSQSPTSPNPDTTEQLMAMADALAASSRKATRDLHQLQHLLEPSLQEAPRYTLLVERAVRRVLALRVMLLAVASLDPASVPQATVQTVLYEAQTLERVCSGTGLTHDFLAHTAGLHQSYALNPEHSCS